MLMYSAGAERTETGQRRVTRNNKGTRARTWFVEVLPDGLGEGADGVIENQQVLGLVLGKRVPAHAHGQLRVREV